MSGYRRAVVTLHEVSDLDRDWILARLPATERATLQAYLSELKDLGFAAGTAFSQPESLPHSEPESSSYSACGIRPNQAAAGDDTRLAAARLRTAPADRIAAILQNEPPSLVVQFMAIEAWPWNERVLRHFEPGLRARVSQARSGLTTVAPSRVRFLTQAVVGRLGTLDVDSLDQRRPIARVANSLRATINRLGGPWRR